MTSRHLSERGTANLWIFLLTAASAVTTMALACATPFAALAALGALYLKRRDGLAMVGLAWIVSQTIGFGLLRYPHDPRTLAWGIGIGAAAMAATFAAYATQSAIADRRLPVRLAITYVAGFVAFKLVILLCSLGLGGVSIALSTKIMTKQFLRDGGILLGLLALYHLLVAIGVPAPFWRERGLQPA